MLRVEKGEELSAHQRISEMADPLHFGTFGGMATKVVWFVFGLAMAGLCVTGMAIYSLRLKNVLAPDELAQRRHGFAGRLWLGMGAWACPSAALVGLMMLPGWLAR